MNLILETVILTLTVALLIQRYQREKLRQWLDTRHNEIPEGFGAWREIFSHLQRLWRSHQREKQALGEHLDRFRQAAQALPDGIILLDNRAHIEWLNVSATHHFGLDPIQDIGTLIKHLIRQRDFHEYLTHFRTDLTQPPLVLTVNHNHTKKVLSIFLFSFAKTGILMLSRDITTIVQTDIIRRDFIANISHELRTPLTVISGFLEQLTEEGALPCEQMQHFLLLMAEQAGRMNRLVEDLLMLSRLENTTTPPRDEIIDISQLLESLIAEGQALSKGRHQIEFAQEKGSCTIRGSYDELRSAFSNLISNAVRYTPPGGQITLTWRCDLEKAIFIVSDTGIGISPEHLPRLTERFYRVDKSRSTLTGGTGLGLAIVKHVLARHHGILTIQSVIGQGSIFSVQLPVETR